jgi:hypothetical protein
LSYLLTDSLSIVSTDATLTGDGTVIDPLHVVDGGGSVYSIAKTVFSNPALSATLPVDTYPDLATMFTQTINTGVDVDFINSNIRFFTTGTYKITMQLTYEKRPDGLDTDIQVELGLTDVIPNLPMYKSIQTNTFLGVASVNSNSVNFVTVLDLVAGDSLVPVWKAEGFFGAIIDWIDIQQATFVIVERLL